jgi:hypothetical protein
MHEGRVELVGGTKLLITQQMEVSVDRTRYASEWTQFISINGNALFQIALLLSGDASTAEAALANGMEDLDTSRPPGEDAAAEWEKAVVIRSVQISTASSFTGNHSLPSLLQPGLWPVMQIERYPRICFVLRMLLGYAASFCAQMLGIEENGIQPLLRTAVVRLHQNDMANSVGFYN